MSVDYKTHIVLKAKTGEDLPLQRQAIPLLTLVHSMTQDISEGDECILPVEVDKETLEQVIKYCEYHATSKADPIPQPLKDKIDNHISEWDKQFLYGKLIEGGDEKKHQGLLAVMSAGQYFGCDGILDLTCGAMASMIQGKNPEQIRALLNMKDEFTDEQRARNAEEAKALADL